MLTFHFIDDFLHCAETFYFDMALLFFYSAFVICAIKCYIQEIIAKTNFKEFFS